MSRVANPLVPAEVQDRARSITGRPSRTARTSVLAGALAAAVAAVLAGALVADAVVAVVLGVLVVAAVLGVAAVLDRRDRRFLAEHPDLTLEVHEYVAVAYRQLVAAADAVAGADLPVSVLADLEVARRTADELLVACHSTHPGDPSEAARIQGASQELCRLADEAKALQVAVREREKVVDGRDVSRVIEDARSSSLASAAESVVAETAWLTGHLGQIEASGLERLDDGPSASAPADPSPAGPEDQRRVRE